MVSSQSRSDLNLVSTTPRILATRLCLIAMRETHITFRGFHYQASRLRSMPNLPESHRPSQRPSDFCLPTKNNSFRGLSLNKQSKKEQVINVDQTEKHTFRWPWGVKPQFARIGLALSFRLLTFGSRKKSSFNNLG